MKNAQDALVAWYHSHARDVPWRIKSTKKADPYKVWLSEIMCQQTTVAAVKPYFAKFTKSWPNVKALADAPEEDVLAAWAGLGYYARARNLHKCAKVVAIDHNGKFPELQKDLKNLPGIGEYTSAAIAAFAFGQNTIIIDGNVERVLSRYYALQTPLPGGKVEIRDKAEQFYGSGRHSSAELAQALMDLGAGICIAKTPRCDQCPLSPSCLAHKKNIAAELPRKEAKKPRPDKKGYIYWIQRDDGKVLFHRRPAKGLLGGMLALPTGPWEEGEPSHAPELKPLGFNTPGAQERVTHTFTHFNLELTPILHFKSMKPPTTAYSWESPESCREALPSVFLKGYRLFEKLLAQS